MHSTALPKNDEARKPSRQRLSGRIAILGVAGALVAAPALLMAPAAFADASFSVTSPTDGQVGVENSGSTVQFTGTGLSDGDTVQVLFTAADGSTQNAVFSGTMPGADAGDWSATANFDAYTDGMPLIAVTVEEVTDDNAATVVKSIPLTFTTKTPVVDKYPFAVTSPAELSTVDTATPTFEGTGAPGSTVEFDYNGRGGTDEVAAKGTIGADGTFAIVSDFSKLEPGAGTATSDGVDAGSSVFVTVKTSTGDAVPSDAKVIYFYFKTAPVPLIPLSVTFAPATETALASATTGTAVAATGFRTGEEVTTVVTDPAGSPVILAGTRPDHIFASDADGSYADTIVLPTGAAAGVYTVVLTGSTTSRTVSGTFTVTADAATPTPTPSPSSAGGSGSSTNTGSNASGTLANTGVDGIGIGALAGVLLLIGGGLVIGRRKARA